MVGSLNRGKKLSSETIEKIREKALNRSSMLDKIKEKCIVHTRPIVLYNLNGTFYGEYSTILEFYKLWWKNYQNSIKNRKRISKKTMNSKRFVN